MSEPIAKAKEKVLKDLYNGPRRDEFFVKDELIRNSSGGVENESFARYILPDVEVQREVANIIGASLEDADYIEAAFRAQNNPDFSLDTLIAQEKLGLPPLSGRNQPSGGQGGGGQGGGTTIDLNVDISEEDTTGTYEDSKAQGVGHFRDVKLSGLDTYVGGDFTYKDEDGNQTRAKIKSLEYGLSKVC